jgi:5,10-methenyltetrahydrofolate synthetase
MPEEERGTASPPCFAHEVREGADGAFHTVDAGQEADVKRWRKAERERLISARMALSQEARDAGSCAIAETLERLIAPGAGQVISLYWPFRGEPDMRPFMTRAHEAGATIALPIVVEKGKPLAFRRWTPGSTMERGVWNILQPAEDVRVAPTVTIAPLVGHDAEGYRLGYGGGFFDRTLASLSPRPRAIGIGLTLTRIATIYPQVWDVPMDAIVTEEGVTQRGG